jgi:hypothetical protein
MQATNRMDLEHDSRCKDLEILRSGKNELALERAKRIRCIDCSDGGRPPLRTMPRLKVVTLRHHVLCHP